MTNLVRPRLLQGVLLLGGTFVVRDAEDGGPGGSMFCVKSVESQGWQVFGRYIFWWERRNFRARGKSWSFRGAAVWETWFFDVAFHIWAKRQEVREVCFQGILHPLQSRRGQFHLHHDARSNFPYWDNPTHARRLPSSRKPSTVFFLGSIILAIYIWDPFIQLAGGVRLGRSCSRQVFPFFFQSSSNESHHAWNDRNSGRLSEVLNLRLIGEIPESKDLSNQKRGYKREKTTCSIDGTNVGLTTC